MSHRFTILLILLTSASIHARELYVSQQHPQAADTSAGTREAPLKTISAAAKMAQAGDTVVVAAGIYRESVTMTNSGAAGKPIVFRSEESRKAVLCGSDVLTQWEAAGPGVWVTTVPVIRKNESALPHSERGGEWVFINGSPLLYSEPGQTQMPGTFRLDHAAGKLFVAPEEGVSLTGVTVEYALREGLFWPDKPLDDIHLVGFTLRHNAIWFRGKHAILMHGRRWLVEDNHILWSTYSGLGMRHTSQCVVRGNVIEWCGEGGMVGGWNTGLTIENNRVQYCNWRRNDPSSMGVGGSKWAFTYDSVVRGNHFAFNQGSGIWFDWGTATTSSSTMCRTTTRPGDSSPSAIGTRTSSTMSPSTTPTGSSSPSRPAASAGEMSSSTMRSAASCAASSIAAMALATPPRVRKRCARACNASPT
jgi:hypothetical protein